MSDKKRPIKSDFDDDDEEELAKELAEATKDDDKKQTISDEEYARRLQNELDSTSNGTNGSASGSGATANYYVPQASTAFSYSGTYASLPNQTTNNVSPHVSLQTDFSYDSPDGVAPSVDYAIFLELKKRASTIKILCVIDFIFALYGLLFRIWWLSFGLVFAPVGFYGAHRYKHKLILSYVIYLIINVIMEFIFTWVNLNTLVVILSLLVIIIQLFIIHYSYQFYRNLPKEGTSQYNQIILHSQEQYQMSNINSGGSSI